jgi:hypothetical protein
VTISGGLDLTGTAADTYPRVLARVLMADPCNSTILLKPSATVAHSAFGQPIPPLPGWASGPPCAGAGPAGTAFETVRAWIACGAQNN